jgi:hypothetical protein
MATPNTWTPSDRDRMIYKWAKFDGHKQSWIAQQLDMNQSTVSRIIERYERWIAHGGPAQQGALNRDERLRAQVALTFERNEWIIASALRLAGEMEHMSDTTRSTTKHHCSEPSREIEVKTENSIRDRTGTANRYLRLAWRIGMDQIKLIEKYDLPALEPFTLDPNEYSEAQADARSGFQSGASPFVEAPDTTVPTDDPGTLTRSVSEDGQPCVSNASPLAPSSAFPSAPMHTTHTHAPPASPLTPTTAITSIEIAPHKNPSAYAYPVATNPPKPTDQLAPILDATTHQPPPPIRILPLFLSPSAP